MLSSFTQSCEPHPYYNMKHQYHYMNTLQCISPFTIKNISISNAAMDILDMFFGAHVHVSIESVHT